MIDRVSSVSYSSLNELLIEEIRALGDAYRNELAEWAGETPGPHGFADLLVPYIVELNEELVGGAKELTHIFDFLEKLANHSNSEISEVIALSVIDPLRNRYGGKGTWYMMMGPRMKQMFHDLEEA